MDIKEIQKNRDWAILELFQRIEFLEKEVKRLESDKQNRRGPRAKS